ncbi:ead/Ea22-like family protein [Cronobacter sakazakii]|nr:ead/Ea22-like family protein [Cronobacter sakazakii]
MNTAKLKAVPRHSVDGYGRQDISYNDPEGEFVFYSDYEALKDALKDALEAAHKRIAELEARERHNERQRVIDGLAAAGEPWEEIQEYMKAWDEARAAGINLETGGEA